MLETTVPCSPSLFHPTPLYPSSRGKPAMMQITPNSPIRRPIIRFLLAVRRKKGSAPVISTDFHPVQRLDGPLSPPLSLRSSVSSRTRRDRSPIDRDIGRLESGISSSGDPLIAVSIFVHTKARPEPFETVNCIRGILRVSSPYREERRRGVGEETRGT